MSITVVIVRSYFRSLACFVKRVSYPALGLLVCLHVLYQMPPSAEFRSPFEDLERIRLRSGSGLEVLTDHTLQKRDFEIPPLFQRTYGKDYLWLHLQQISFVGEHGSVMYVRFSTKDEATRAERRTVETWNSEIPMAVRAYGDLLVRVIAPPSVFHDLSDLAFAGIEANLGRGSPTDSPRAEPGP